MIGWQELDEEERRGVSSEQQLLASEPTSGGQISVHLAVVHKSKTTGAEIAVVVTKHDVVSVADIKKSSYVFDCTGSIPGADGI